MEINAHDQLSHSLDLAEQQVRKQQEHPNLDPRQLELQQKEVDVLRRKLELQPR